MHGLVSVKGTECLVEHNFELSCLNTILSHIMHLKSLGAGVSSLYKWWATICDPGATLGHQSSTATQDPPYSLTLSWAPPRQSSFIVATKCCRFPGPAARLRGNFSGKDRQQVDLTHQQGLCKQEMECGTGVSWDKQEKDHSPAPLPAPNCQSSQPLQTRSTLFSLWGIGCQPLLWGMCLRPLLCYQGRVGSYGSYWTNSYVWIAKV